MSYILDAIKKADQKRKLGSVPDVHTVHESPATPSSRLMWPYMLAAGLFINALIIVVWLQPWAAKEQPVPTEVNQQSIAEKNPAREDTPDSDIIDQKEEILSDQLGDIGQEAIDNANGFDPLAEETATDLATPKAEQEISITDPPPQTIIIPADDGTLTEQEQTTTEPEQDKEDTADTAEQAQEEALPEPLDEENQEPRIVGRIGGTPLPDSGNINEDDLLTEQEMKLKKRQLSKIPYMFQLPASVKNTMPEIHVSFHSYVNKASSRLVSINGKILREGQSFEKDLTLEQITADGVVILYKSRRFRIDL